MKTCSFLFLCFYLFLLETQTALLTNTPVPHVNPWRTSLRVLMGMSSRYISLSTPLPPPTQLRVGGGCCMWGLQYIPLNSAGGRGLRQDLTTLEQEDWGEAREKCLISAGRNREWGEDLLSGLNTAQFSRAHAWDWDFACLANITRFLNLGDYTGRFLLQKAESCATNVLKMGSVRPLQPNVYLFYFVGSCILGYASLGAHFLTLSTQMIRLELLWFI